MSDAPRWDVEGRNWPLAEHSRFVDAAGLRWHIQQFGSGPDLLLIHGTGAATHSWRDLAPLLAEHFTVTAFDLPGHGFTSGRPRGGFALPNIAQAVGALMAALGITPQIIVGHSAGAAIALQMILTAQVAPAGVVGLSAALRPFPGLAGKLFPSLARMLFLNPFAPHIFARIARAPGEPKRFLERSTASRIDARGIESYGRLFARAGHCAGALSLMAEWKLEPLADAMPRLKVPLLLIHGSVDAAVPVSAARESAALVPNAQLEIMAGLGHLAHEEQPDAVAARILQFARGIGVAMEAAA